MPSNPLKLILLPTNSSFVSQKLWNSMEKFRKIWVIKRVTKIWKDRFVLSQNSPKKNSLEWNFHQLKHHHRKNISSLFIFKQIHSWEKCWTNGKEQKTFCILSYAFNFEFYFLQFLSMTTDIALDVFQCQTNELKTATILLLLLTGHRGVVYLWKNNSIIFFLFHFVSVSSSLPLVTWISFFRLIPLQFFCFKFSF